MIILKKTYFFISILLSISCFACAAPLITLPKDFEMSAQAVKDKIPLTAGLYLTPYMRNYNPRFGYPYSMADALSSGCERMLRNIFNNVVIIDQMDTNLSSKNIDVIVTPEVIALNRQVKALEGYNTRQIVYQMIIRWDIVSPGGGKSIYTTTITSEVREEPLYYFLLSTHVEKAKERMILLLNNQFRKAQDDIYLGGWWKKQWWKNAN